MRLILESAESIRLDAAGDGLVVEPAGDVGLSAFHLLAASLALCTRSVLQGWADQAGVPTAGLELTVDWSFGEDPVRVSELRMGLLWPALPPQRHEAARRAAAHCTVHHTLEHGTRVRTQVTPSAG
jgi:uncharacterized OsmC-like protein